MWDNNSLANTYDGTFSGVTRVDIFHIIGFTLLSEKEIIFLNEICVGCWSLKLLKILTGNGTSVEILVLWDSRLTKGE